MNYVRFAEIVLGFSVGYILSSFVLPRISLVAFKKRLFDIVDERKVHTAHIPRLGGISFFPCITIAVLCIVIFHNFWLRTNLFDSRSSAEFSSIICSMIIVYLMGMMDDLIGVRYRSKFMIQIICGVLLIASGIYFDNLGGLFGINGLPHPIGIPFTILVVVYILNSINLIDGIDGLASGLSIIAFLAFGCIFISLEWWIYAYISFASIGVLLYFFYCNVLGKASRGRKLFMGDTGSLTIGMLLAAMAIKLCKSEMTKDTIYPNALLLAFSFLIVPLLDVVRVVIHRLRCGRSPFLPDKNHIHHKFMQLGFSQRKAMISIILISIFFASLNLLLMDKFSITELFITDVMIWTIMHCTITVKINRILKSENKKQNKI